MWRGLGVDSDEALGSFEVDLHALAARLEPRLDAAGRGVLVEAFPVDPAASRRGRCGEGDGLYERERGL